MAAVDKFSNSTLEGISRYLGDLGTGSDIDRAFTARSIVDVSGESTKWKRLHKTFIHLQAEFKCANQVLGFIMEYCHPSRFVGRANDFAIVKENINALLSFEGVEFGDDGKFRPTKRATTLSEAEQRLGIIKRKFAGRAMHSEVYKYCNTELLQENYFHAVFEASKGLAERIRSLSGVSGDGASLVDKVFSIEKPYLVFNTLQTETEKSEHKGFAALIKGCFGAVRNPLAHEPKILWDGEDDAVDYLTLISLLHRRLDNCVKTNIKDGMSL